MRRFFLSTIASISFVPFISSWRTTNTSTGSSTSNQVKLPLLNGGTYNFTVEWGDGNDDVITVWNQAEVTHTYGASGDYVISITGTCIGWAFSNTKDRLKILNVSQWGSLLPGPIDAFRGCGNFNFTATDIPDLSNTSMAGFFDGCSSLTGNSSINDWDVSGKTTFSSCFLNCSNFNQPLGNWDVSSATAFFNTGRAGIFGGATLFNQDLSGWDVSNVINMTGAFQNSGFNQNIGSWNVSKVTAFVNFMAGKSPSNFSTANLDAIYNGWTNRSLSVLQAISFGTAKYTAAATAARALLTGTNTTVTVTNAVNNGSGLIQITTGTAHGRTTGDKVFISGILGTTEANGGWRVTVIDATTIDLQASTFTNTYVSGGTVRTGYGWTITDGGI